MADIKNGASELNTVTLSLPDAGKELKNWQSYTVDSNYLDPSDTFRFEISADDAAPYQELFVPGSNVQMKIENFIQCSGYIGNTHIQGAPNNGVIISFAGRDILSRLINANAPPRLKLKKDMTVLDLLSKFNYLYNFGKIYNSESTNLNVITGRANNESVKTKTTTAQEISYQKNSDGSLAVDSDGKYITTLKDNPIVEVISAKRPELKNIKIKELKPHPGEGAYAFLDRMLARLGFKLKAMSDGSGIMVSSPNFDGDSYGTIYNKRGNNSAKNNVKSFNYSLDWNTQPSVIIAEGFGGGKEFGKSKIQVIMINELIGLDANGQPLPEIQDIKAAYPNAFVMPIRQNLVPKKQFLGIKNAYCPTYIKDDESKTIEELKFAVTRKLAEHQRKATTLTYTLPGFTNAKGEPWAVNTTVDVDDDFINVHEKMWIIGRTFTKSLKEGTVTQLRLIKPYTLIIG